MKKILLGWGLIAAVMCVFTFNAVAAAEEISISLQINNEMVTINGEEIEVVKPYLSNDVTLVPLRVISTGFAAKINWSSETQTVRILYGDQVIQLVIGTKTAVINEEFIELQTAPELINGTTMVPLRFITQSFGALIDYEPATKEITITSNPELQPSEESEVNSDSTDIVSGQNGKAYIGDSYYNWTIKYPTFLSFDGQSDKGDGVWFRDADGNYNLSIAIEPAENVITDKMLLERLAEEIYTGETILDKKMVSEKVSYARILTKDGDVYYDHRAYVNNGYVYILIMSFYKSEDFLNTEVQLQYQELLDSFEPSFNKDESNVQDITVAEEDGYRTFTHQDYGISLRIPADWYTGAERDYFYNEDESAYLYYIVSSIVSEQTVEEWSEMANTRYAEMVAPEYVNISDKEVVMNGDTKVLMYHSLLQHGTVDRRATDIYIHKDNHKYMFTIAYPPVMTKAEVKSLIDTIVNSIEIDTTTLPFELGHIEDKVVYDLSARTTYKDKGGKYSIDIPEYWILESDSESLEAFFLGGSFKVYSVEGMGKDLIIERAVENMTSAQNTEFKQKKKVMVNGQSMDLIISETTREGTIYEVNAYIFEKGGYTYVISIDIGEPYATSSNRARFEEALQSFQFLD